MGDFSVKAVLSAVDKNFSSTMKGALGYASNLKSTLTSGIGFGAMMAIGQNAINTVTNKMSSLSKETIETSDSMYKLQAAMRFSGYAEDEIQRIAGATGSLKTYADKTVFSLQDVMSTFGALSANGIKDADKLTEAVGNAVAVFGGGAQEYSSVALAFSQAMAAGALHAQDWNQILNASPQLAGGLRKELIRLNPVLGEDFKGAMEEGAITADLLAEAMNNIGMTDMAKEAATSVTTFEGAMGNLEATAVSGMLKLYDTFAKSQVIDVINGFNDKVAAGFEWLAVSIPKTIDDISPYWKVLKEEFGEVKAAFGDAVGAITGELRELNGAFGSPESINNFSDVLGTASDALKTFAGFCEEHADVIAEMITLLPKLYVAYRGFKIVKAVAPFVGAFTGAIGGLVRLGLGKLAPNLFKVAKGQDSVGKSSGGSSKKILASAKAFAMLGAGVLMISAGFYLLAQSAVSVAESGPLAVGVLAGLVGVVTGLSIGMAKMLSSMKGGTKKLATMSTALLALGASILLISAGFWILSDAAVRLAETGPLAVGVMAGLVVGLGALLLVAKSVAPSLSAGAAGFIAFGAAVILVGAGITVLTNAAINLANAGPLAIGIMVGMVAVIALLAVGAAALGPALTAGAVGFIAFSVSVLIVSAALSLLLMAVSEAAPAIMGIMQQFGDTVTQIMTGVGDVITSVGDAISGILDSLAGVFDAIGVSALNAGKGFKKLAEGVEILIGLNLLDMGASMTAVAAGIGAITAVSGGLSEAGSGMKTLGAGLLIITSNSAMAAAGLSGIVVAVIPLMDTLPSLTPILSNASAAIVLFAAGVILSLGSLSGTQGIILVLSASVAFLRSSFNSTNASVIKFSGVMGSVAGVSGKTGTAFQKVQTSARTMGQTLIDTGNKGKTTMNQLMAVFDATAVKAGIAGQKTGNGFASGVSNGGSKAVSAANNISRSVISSMRATSSGSYSCGYYIGTGLANGMRATLGIVRSVASQLAVAAEAAIRAKAKIHSPSRISTKLGVFWGEGYVNGLLEMVKDAKKATEKLVTIPSWGVANMQIPAYAGNGNMELNDEYSYSHNATYTIVVPLELEGREFARATASYTQEELDDRERFANYRKGYR